MLEWFARNWFISLLIINYVVALSAAFFLLRNNQNPRKTLSSLLFLVAFPFIGLVIYYFFGLEYRKSKIFKRKDINSHDLIKKWNDRLFISDKELEDFDDDFLEDRVKMVKLLRHNDSAPLTRRNDLTLLINGKKTFESIFKDLDQATDHIHLEYFIIQDDVIGNKIIDKLVGAAQRGVEVKLIYDSVGSNLSGKARRRMRAVGIELNSFMPVIFSNFTRKANYRNHRKIIVIDGHIGYLGGVNISDDYVNTGERGKMYWRDTHLRIEGHAVKSLQSQWLLNWFFVSKNDNLPIKESYFPEIDENIGAAVQIAASGPDTDWANIMEAIFSAITTAEHSIRITTPYFIPNEAILTALKSASRSGIDVHILVPETGDSWAARYASRSYFEEILRSGARVSWYCKGMLHAKTMVVDDKFATVGTSNMDYRSFDINFEINALIYDDDIAQQLNVQFEKDLESSQEIILDRWAERSKVDKFKESFCRLWAPLL
ncbi:cardiolipin synthase [Nonlabens ponticola]|uniref:Cardiolipin synthase n=1 Tax=Nonlabens ponticola TaxID=2496866 RepID=A0A3S9MZM6_9FLAO|nr:cardiolipin synthase [Nonlabens ponticola]AZQ44617.1 cardiolipin synthase [Nonlabens ponticola]